MDMQQLKMPLLVGGGAIAAFLLFRHTANAGTGQQWPLSLAGAPGINIAGAPGVSVSPTGGNTTQPPASTSVQQTPSGNPSRNYIGPAIPVPPADWSGKHKPSGTFSTQGPAGPYDPTGSKGYYNPLPASANGVDLTAYNNMIYAAKASGGTVQQQGAFFDAEVKANVQAAAKADPAAYANASPAFKALYGLK